MAFKLLEAAEQRWWALNGWFSTSRVPEFGWDPGLQLRQLEQSKGHD
jgi:hypothetical protein